MRKVLHVIKCIFLLAFLVFMILCCHSCSMQIYGQGFPALDGAGRESLFTPVDPDLTLSSGSYPKDTTELVAVVTPSDLEMLDLFPSLQSVDFAGSTCYTEIAEWVRTHPNVNARYTVTLPDGQTPDNRTEELNLAGMSESDLSAAAQLLSYLPALKTIDLGVAEAGNILSADTLAAVAAACPKAALNYSLSVLGKEVRLSDTDLDLSELVPAQVPEVLPVLRSMTQLRTLHIGSQMNGLTWNDIAQIHDAAPEAALDYAILISGVLTNLNATELNFSHILMYDEGAAVRQVLPYMKNLKTLDMDFCGVSNESMAAIRDAFPNVNVIWRIWFAENYSVRTDVERILASSTANGGTVTNAEAAKLQYCTKVKYLDLGHNGVLTDISFVRCMPDLEVLILAINDISDISPLADCPKLEYLEINSTNVTDLTPLSNSMALRHLNIGRTAQLIDNTGDDLKRPRVTDISPLYGLKDLERLWIGSVTAPSIPAEQIEHMKECAPNCVINTEDGDPSQGLWRTTGERPDWVWAQWVETGVFNDPLNERYQLLREQFQYDLGIAAYSLAENDPLY